MENQQLEWKETWRDEYLKWICGFANAQGGMLVIGKNDKGKTIGVENAEKLLEDLPNKIRSTMGVVADVNLKKENGLDFIEITVPAYPNIISYRGKYYLRSGSTNQELSGYTLDSLLLGKYGRTYDSMPLPRIKMSDFWHDAFDIFRKKAVASKRLTTEDVAVTDEELLQSLSLMENDYLLLAAALVFHQTPQQWCIGAYVKIGYFTNNAEILYQDELYGSLVGMADKVVETIFTKYFIGRIRYEGLQRIDDYPMPRTALREAVMNALVHRDYSTGTPIQIRVYDDHLTIANDCRLPEGTTFSGLMAAHKSVSINPLVAIAIFRSGQIEAWGRGLERIVNLCVADNLPKPEFFITPQTFTIYFHVRNNNTDTENENSEMNFGKDFRKDFRKDFSKDFGLNETQKQIIVLIEENKHITKRAISQTLNLTERNIEYAFKVLKDKCLIERIGTRKIGYWKIIKPLYPDIEDINDEANFGIKDGKDFGLNETQKQIIVLIEENKHITKRAISQKLNLTERNIEYAFKVLIDKCLIERIGTRKTGYWKINKEDN